MSGGFPVTPTGSPGSIEGLAASLASANSGFQAAAAALKQTSSGLGGISWSGPAEERFSSSAHGLAQAASTYHETLGDVAKALRSYAHALEHAQRVIDEARTEYEAAKAAQADAQTIIGSLRIQVGHVDPDQRAGVEDRIDGQQSALRRATHTAADALKRAVEAREDFDRAQRKATAALSGSSSPTAPTLGSLSGPFTNNAGTGGGILGGGFGVPPGGLGNLSGEVPWNELDDLDGLARNSWLDSHGQTEVDDLEHVIDAALLATGIGGVVKIGFNLSRAAARRLASMTAAKKAEREAAERGMTAAEREAKAVMDEEEVLKTYIEKFGELGGNVGIPQADNIAKVVAVATMRGNRVYIAMKVRQLEDVAKNGIAVLQATGALHQGVRRGIPPDVLARIEKLADDAMKAGRGG
jgi:uncharacterized protein YukE